MLHNETKSEKDSVESTNPYFEHVVENRVDDNLKDYDTGEEEMDLTIRDILVARVISEARDFSTEAKFDSDSKFINQECEKNPTASLDVSEPSGFPFAGGSSKEIFSTSSYPIPLAMQKNIEEETQMRVLNGKPPEKIRVWLPGDFVPAKKGVTEEEQCRKYQEANWSDLEAYDLTMKSRMSIDRGREDEVKTSRNRAFSLGSLSHQKNEIDEFAPRKNSTSPIITKYPSSKSGMSTQNEQRLSGVLAVLLSTRQGSQPLVSDLSLNLRNVQMRENIDEELGDRSAEGYEMWTTKQNDEYETFSAQSTEVSPRRSTMSITRKDNMAKNKQTTPVTPKCEFLQEGQTNFVPKDENKRTPTNQYARSVAEISEKLAQFLPEKPWAAPSVDRSRCRSRQGERSVTRSISSVAPSRNPSTADIFSSTLVNEISTEHSYLKPCDNSKVTRNWRSYKLPRQYEKGSHTAFTSYETRTVDRYTNPFHTIETDRIPEIEKPPEAQSWFYSIFSNISVSQFI